MLLAKSLDEHTVKVMNLLSDHKDQIDLVIKEKPSRAQVYKDYQFVAEKAFVVETKLDQIICGGYYESLIERKIKDKAEQRDVESLDKNKADISAVQELMEKVVRIEKIIEEGLVE